jgi:hypothetical protein
MRALSPLIAARCSLRLALLAVAALFIHTSEAGSSPPVVARSPADPYDAWRRAESRATLALAAWREAPHGDKGAAYVSYLAALAAEAHAARLLQGLSRSQPRRS